MKKKHYFILIIIAILFIIVTIIITIFKKDTNKITKELQGVKISRDSLEVIENVTIKINGIMDENESNNGFRFIFTGKLHLSNLDYSDGNHSLLIYSKGYGEDGMMERGFISYPRNIRTNGVIVPDFATVQMVYTDSNLSYLILANYDDDAIHHPSEDSIKASKEDDILVFPATDASSALALINELQIDPQIFN